jgi:hypothetical protein
MKQRIRSLREIDRARGNLDWAVKHIDRIYRIYEEPHPEIAQLLEMAIKAIIVADELLLKAREQI